jgi:hypothetical protein
MSKRGDGVILYGDGEPDITGYLIIGNKHYAITGTRVTKLRTHIKVVEDGDTSEQKDLFDATESGEGV